MPAEPANTGEEKKDSGNQGKGSGEGRQRGRRARQEKDLPSDKHAAEVRAIMAELGFPEDSPECRQWCALGRGDMALHKIAHRDALNAPRPLDAAFAANFETVVRLFDVVLERFETRYATVYERLDALLAQSTPHADDIDLLQQKVPNTPQTLGYFFERLAHIGWLGPLHRAGFFRAVPPPDIDSVRGTIRFPHWMAAEYLLRTAAELPSDVTAILESLPDTENVRVQAQLIDVMLRLRPQDRERLTGRVIGWIPQLARYHWGDHAPRFATALARDGAIDLAFRTTQVILDLPASDADGVRRPVRVADYQGSRERADHLREAAMRLVPALAEVDALRTVSLLADALDYQVGRRPDEVDADPNTPEGLTDFSTLWADDLGERDRIDASELRLYLVHVLLSTVVSVTLNTPASLGAVVTVLRARGARVIRRIELAALAALVTRDDPGAVRAALPLAVERLTARALVVESDLDAEYAALLQAAFPKLGSDERSLVLTALEPPDFSWMKMPEYQRHRSATWRRDRLALIADHLPEPERDELATLSRETGEPEGLGHRRHPIASFTGPASPLNSAALREMDADALLKFVSTWEPRAGFAEPSPEGLGHQLATMAAENPTEYSLWAPRFVGAPPTYVRSLLDGFASAARAGKTFPWRDVLTLAAWVTEQPTSDDDLHGAEQADFERDADWRSARRTVADLMGLALELDPGEEGALPEEEVERVWGIISILAEDPNPSVSYEAKYGGTNMDPATLAINTTRPEAIDAAIRYAYWRAQLRTRGGTTVRGAINDCPEVARLLEAHLDPTRDPSLATRAAIGRWLTSFARTDPDWVRHHAKALLPSAPDQEGLRDALWDAFVQWTQPHPDALPVLEPHYREAVSRTGLPRGTRNAGAADNHLAEHIVTLYWWGALSLDAPDSLISYFFEHADAERRTHAVKHVGFSLYHTEKPVPKEPVTRLQRLWEWRAPQLSATARRLDQDAGADELADARDELKEFGWWFASGAFEPAWALDHLAAVLNVTGSVELEHAVAERLAELAPTYPLLTVGCLAAIDYSGGGEPWSVRSWLEHLPTIVRAAFSSGESEARRVAREVVNRAVAAGHTEHRGLLAEDTEG